MGYILRTPKTQPGDGAGFGQVPALGGTDEAEGGMGATSPGLSPLRLPLRRKLQQPKLSKAQVVLVFFIAVRVE